jgi:hypothetical protein
MKTLIKTSCIAALALAMTAFVPVQARAGGWGIAGGVVGGLAVGTAIGVSVASAARPVYYSYPPPVYAAPAYYAPAVAYAPAPAYYYGPRVVYAAPFAYGYPYARVGHGWGPRYFRGGPYYRR